MGYMKTSAHPQVHKNRFHVKNLPVPFVTLSPFKTVVAGLQTELYIESKISSHVPVCQSVSAFITSYFGTAEIQR